MFTGHHSSSESDSEPTQHHTVVANVHKINESEFSKRRSGTCTCNCNYCYTEYSRANDIHCLPQGAHDRE